ncbi:MAG TPA: NAD(P)-binding domain-containing protein, partial [Candidatus Poseidoniia archaeon]|nr:NAD(P)-binding domain-containing protein [Candidatus Poseidoniia archaeon]
MDQLEDKIKSKDAKIGIIGMGYVGIPLGLEFSDKGFTVLGFDKDTKRVDDINAGKQIMKHITKKSMDKFVENKGSATAEFSRIKNM